jgi:hypothetical protein
MKALKNCSMRVASPVAVRVVMIVALLGVTRAFALSS